MDPFAEGMTARGPTLAADRATWTGSLHIVDLPGADAAQEFVEREPYNRAGLFGGHVVRRFKNRLGRTMWEFPGSSGDPRFLVIAHLRAGERERDPALPQAEFPAVPGEQLIVHGELSTPGEAAPAGIVLALQAPTRGAVDALLDSGKVGLEERFDVEIHDWECGGRR